MDISKVKFGDRDSVGEFIRHVTSDRTSGRTAFEGQIRRNIMWYLGQQNFLWDPGSNDLILRPIESNSARRRKVRLIYNIIRPMVDQLIGSLPPIIFEVVPATDTIEDLKVSRVSQSVLAYYSDFLNLHETINLCDLWTLIAGQSFIKVTWDPEKGGEVDLSSLGQSPRIRKFLKQMLEREGIELEEVSLGDLEISCVPPLNILWGPRGVDFNDAEWVIELFERSRTYILDRYKISEEELEKAPSRKVWRLDDLDGRNSSASLATNNELVTVAELWVKRSKSKTPNGWHAIMVGEKVVKSQTNPYRHGMMPYVTLKWQTVPGRVRGDTIFNDLLSPQADINRNLSQQVEARETVSNPFVLAHQNSIANYDEWVGIPGGIRIWKGTLPPQVVPGAGMPSSASVLLNTTHNLMKDISGVHDVSQAKAPPGVKSGVGILRLQEQDQSRIAPFIRRRSFAWGRVGHLALKVLRQFLQENRVARIRGEDNRSEIIEFNADSFVGRTSGANYFDVRVRTTGLPRTRTTQLELLGALVNMGALDPRNNADDRDRILQILEIGDTRNLADRFRLDREVARRENERMINGEVVVPHIFDADQIHIAEIDEMVKRDGGAFFESLPKETQQMILNHREMHEKLMAEKAVKLQVDMAQAQAKLQGTAGIAPQPQNNR